MSQQRLIDAEYLRRLITETAKEFDNIEVHNIACLFNALIDDIQTVEAVEVVRFKDCIYYEKGKDYQPYCEHIDGLGKPTDNDFCSHGERREEE